MKETDIYRAIGEDGFTRLVAAFYRQVPDDDILGPLYPPDELPAAEMRLRELLVTRFGGPARHHQPRGRARPRRRRFRFPIDGRAADRWLELMDRALRETALPPEVDTMLRAYFEAVAAAMVTRG